LKPLDRLLGSLDASWGLLGRSWGPPGASWGALGGFLGPLERLLGRLGSDPKQHQNYMRKKINFQTPQRRRTEPKWDHFEGPKSTKIDSKMNQKLRRFSRAKKNLFKSLLEPSWADLGAFWRPSWQPNMRSGTRGRVFGETSRFGCG